MCSNNSNVQCSNNAIKQFRLCIDIISLDVSVYSIFQYIDYAVYYISIISVL